MIGISRSLRSFALFVSLAALPSCAAATHASKPTTSAVSPAVQLGESAEELFDAAWASTWDKAEAPKGAARSAVADLRATADPAVATRIEALWNDLDGALARRDRLAALTSSNELTREALALAAPSAGGPPREIGLLDVEGRALRIAAEQGDLPRARTVAGEIKRVWGTARPSVVARGGTKESSQFDATVASLDAASSAQAYAAVAQTLLDQVDLLEKVYAQAPAPRGK